MIFTVFPGFALEIYLTNNTIHPIDYFGFPLNLKSPPLSPNQTRLAPEEINQLLNNPIPKVDSKVYYSIEHILYDCGEVVFYPKMAVSLTIKETSMPPKHTCIVNSW
ncbi:hypothetical protein [Legionella sainthelensi]|uniref:hypothetical protein n=1 Tax=Legionella sainthelensi TaxID=28087 RepID=UPI000F6FA075|nr:hypothetical protein [Legionella sainthelensi]VEH34700.1 Uncharacterised protein [Legionella sainthelensi]